MKVATPIHFHFVSISVEDFPTEEVLDEMNAESEFDFVGRSRATACRSRAVMTLARLPNLIWLYRRPILDYWAEHEESLGHIVGHELYHEIGHHFGLSDGDMESDRGPGRGLALHTEGFLGSGPGSGLETRGGIRLSRGPLPWTSSPL